MIVLFIAARIGFNPINMFWQHTNGQHVGCCSRKNEKQIRMNKWKSNKFYDKDLQSRIIIGNLLLWFWHLNVKRVLYQDCFTKHTSNQLSDKSSGKPKSAMQTNLFGWFWCEVISIETISSFFSNRLSNYSKFTQLFNRSAKKSDTSARSSGVALRICNQQKKRPELLQTLGIVRWLRFPG